ncbi:hypothetical protein HPP92_026888, partial [Vanilla planifolia]
MRTTSYIELLESARLIELSWAYWRLVEGEKGSFSDLHPHSQGGEVVPVFPEERGTSYADSRLQYNQAKERSESGNMDKGNGKEQQGDTQQELAQTLVSLLRSIGGT